MKDEIRDEVANKIWAMPRDPSSEVVYETTDAILAIPSIAIVDREAELPEIMKKDSNGLPVGALSEAFQLFTQQGMLKAGWVKEIS